MTNWAKVPNFPYEVSDTGAVRRSGTQRQLKPELVGGYLRVDLRNKDHRWRELIHRLVLVSFIGWPPDGHEAAHLDGNRLNNCLTNLEWKTRKDNHADKHRHGTIPTGENHWASLLSDEDYAKIAEHTESHSQTAEEYGINRSTVVAIRRRHRLKGEIND